MVGPSQVVFQWSITNDTGTGGNAVPIDVTVADPSNTADPPIPDGVRAGGTNIQDGKTRMLTLAAPKAAANGVYDYVFVVTQNGGAAKKTFTIYDPWLVVY